jgi:hypothetical protein
LYSGAPAGASDIFQIFFHLLSRENSGIVLRLGQESLIENFFQFLLSTITSFKSIQTEKLTESWKNKEERKERGKE